MSIPPCDKPGGMGLARIVEIDTTGGPGFGFEHFKQYDFLRDKEVVLTFDDGPWPGNTPAVLKALADKCIEGDVLRDRRACGLASGDPQAGVAAGMTSAPTPGRKGSGEKPVRKGHRAGQDGNRDGLQRGEQGCRRRPLAPFFRFRPCSIRRTRRLYEPNATSACSPTDFDSRDFKMRKPEDVIKSVMNQLEKHGKGIILMHDFRPHTAKAMPELLRQMKAGGYKVVHMVPKGISDQVPKYRRNAEISAIHHFSRRRRLDCDCAGRNRRGLTTLSSWQSPVMRQRRSRSQTLKL